VRDGNAVGRAQTAESPALHRAGKAFALGYARNVDVLAGDEMIRADRHANIEERILGDTEFDHLGLGLDLGLAERGALRLGDVLRLGRAGAQLAGVVPSRSFSRRPTTWTSSSWRTVT